MLNDTVRLDCEKTQLLLNQVQLGYECYMFYFLHVIYHKKMPLICMRSILTKCKGICMYIAQFTAWRKKWIIQTTFDCDWWIRPNLFFNMHLMAYTYMWEKRFHLPINNFIITILKYTLSQFNYDVDFID